MKMHAPSSFTTYPADIVCREITVLHADNGQPHDNPFICAEVSTSQTHLCTYRRNGIFFLFKEGQGPS